ncbi:universal stress protein [Sulfitobacter donghicola]|nr:universal stress protein [Sulfitobacter donghicola]KIN68530.1 UspA protein [Sulfitobacter donghicola DSW-25 = KCTC 12864 = JCM 14565]
MITSIVVGVDGSKSAGRALLMACEMANQFGAALHISHTPRDETVTHAVEAISGFYVGPNAAHQEVLQEAAEKLIDGARKVALDAGVEQVEVNVGQGDPARDLTEMAQAVNADLIITGRRGLGDLGAFVLGSTSHQISKQAKCACMTVP